MQRSIAILFLFINVNLYSQSISFNTYMNPVIPGDHPDCTLTKVGNDYYTTGSSFNVTPTIYHSTDLVHWEAIAQPVSASWLKFGDKPGGECWGGQIVFYPGEYWNYFSRDNTQYRKTFLAQVIHLCSSREDEKCEIICV
jgi:xylan 1,4-beta-xylosidase